MNPVLAIVIENIDPEGAGRVMIRATELDPFQTFWAPVLQSFGAAGRVGKPTVGDKVLVIYLNGDESLPVVIGRLAEA